MNRNGLHRWRWFRVISSSRATWKLKKTRRKRHDGSGTPSRRRQRMYITITWNYYVTTASGRVTVTLTVCTMYSLSTYYSRPGLTLRLAAWGSRSIQAQLELEVAATTVTRPVTSIHPKTRNLQVLFIITFNLSNLKSLREVFHPFWSHLYV